MKYDIFGPFEIPRNRENKRHIDRSNAALKTFWGKVESEHPSLRDACGCYVFGVRAGKGITPQYVGKAQAQAFQKECFGLHTIAIYNDTIANTSGTPILFLIAKRSSGGRFVKPSRNNKDIHFLETLLIATAIKKNPELSNIKKTKMLKEIVVPGIINSPQGKPSGSVLDFKLTIY